MRRPRLIGIVTAAVLAALLITVHHVVIPLQKAGALDDGAVMIAAVAAIVNMPGMMVSRFFYVTEHHVPLEDVSTFLLLSSLVTAALWGLAVYVVARRLRGQPAPDGPTDRRVFLRRAGAAAAAGTVAGLGVYATLVEPLRLKVRQLHIAIKDLPPELEGLRVLHLSDLHLGWYTSTAFLQRVAERANAQKTDLILLTGDYVLAGTEYIRPVSRIIGSLTPEVGTLAVMGNHDHWVGAEQSRAGIQASGARLLENQSMWIDRDRQLVPARPAGGGLCIAGLEDPWEGRPSLDRALAGARKGDPRLLMCHNPDFAENADVLTCGHRVDLMLSGHTHGGQVRLPRLGTPITPSRYGARYAHGLVQGPKFPVYVSAGVGTTILPVRFRVPPEMTVITLTREQKTRN